MMGGKQGVANEGLPITASPMRASPGCGQEGRAQFWKRAWGLSGSVPDDGLDACLRKVCKRVLRSRANVPEGVEACLRMVWKRVWWIWERI